MWIEEVIDDAGNKKYKYCERYKNTQTGRWQRVSVTYTKRTNRAAKLAQDELARKIAEKQAGQVKDITFYEMVIQWFEQERNSKRISTQATIKSSYKRFFRIWDKDLLLSQITVHMAEDMLNCLYHEYHYSWSVIRDTRSLLGRVIRFAKRRGYTVQIDYSEIIIRQDALTPEDIQNKQKKYLEIDEVYCVLAEIRSWQDRLPLKTFFYNRIAEAFEFQFLTGLRWGELAGLLESDYHADEKTIDIRRSYTNFKVGKGENTHFNLPKNLYSLRTIALSDRACEIIEKIIEENKMIRVASNCRYKNSCKLNLIFIGTGGGHLTNNRANKVLKQVTCISGKKLTTHIFRHSHITHLATDLGIPLAAVAKRVGHCNTNTTASVYLHATESGMEKIITALNAEEKSREK